MDELVDLLERTTPSVTTPDVRALTRRARRRRGRRWAAFAVPVIVLAVGAIAAMPSIGGHARSAGQPEPIGTWRRATTPPIDVTTQMRTVPLDTDRLLVVAGSFDVDMPAHRFEAAVYDTSADRWTRIADAPVAPTGGGADLLTAADRCMLVTHDDAGHVRLALLDGRSLEWQPIRIPSDAGHVFAAWAWDGTTFALARFGYTPYGDPSGRPVVERWNADTNAWSPGATPPFAPRFLPSTARTHGQLAVWGGQTFDQNAPGSLPLPNTAPNGEPAPPTSVGNRHDPPRRVFTDGAVYDIHRDAWTYLAPDPQLAEVARRGAAATLGSGTLTLVSSQVDGSARVVEEHASGAWTQLPSPAAGGGIFVDQDTATIALAGRNQSGPQPSQYLDATAQTWRSAPAYQLTPTANTLIATSATMDNPGDSNFRVWRLDGNTWTRAADAPFANRMEPGVGVVGSRVLVIGGLEGPNLTLRRDAWMLDLSK